MPSRVEFEPGWAGRRWAGSSLADIYVQMQQMRRLIYHTLEGISLCAL